MTLAPFIATFSGGRAYPLGLDPEAVLIEDIAHSLSQQCRYAGHTSEFWSVGAHSLEVSRRIEQRYADLNMGRCPKDPEWANPAWFYGCDDARIAALCGLLHDACEAYLQDIVKPVKPLVQGYDKWEANVELAIAERFSLPMPFPHVVKMVDDEMVRHEVANFFPAGSAAWKRYGITNREDYDRLLPLDPKVAERRFLARFKELTA